MKKKAAFELSISTVIIVAIGAVLLILGLILVRNIFDAASNAVDLVDKNTKSQLSSFFAEDDTLKSYVYLPDKIAEVKKGKRYNIEFGIRNTVRGSSNAGQFTYSVEAVDVTRCGSLTADKAESYIVLRRTGGPLAIGSGDKQDIQLRVDIPEDAPLCIIGFDIIIKKDSQPYDINQLDLDIIAG